MFFLFLFAIKCNDVQTITFKRIPTVTSDNVKEKVVSFASYKVILESVDEVADEAFYGCNGLLSITILASTRSIGKAAFQNCEKLQDVQINKEASISEIPEGTFYGCTSLKSVTIPSRVSTIGEKAFFGCKSLTSASFIAQDSIKSIGAYAFSECTSLEEAKLPSITKIEENTFSLTNLQSIVLPSLIEEIGNNAFQGCKSLKSIYYCGAKQPKYATNAFDGCDNAIAYVSSSYALISFCDLKTEKIENENKICSVNVPTTTTEVIIRPTPTPKVIKEVTIYYENNQEESSDGEIIRTSNLANVTFPVNNNINTVTVYVKKNMNDGEYLDLSNLKNVINLSFISLFDIYDVNFMMSQLINNIRIDKLTFSHVNLNLLDKPDGKVVINELIFRNGASVKDNRKFEELDLSKLRSIEYLNFDMLIELQTIFGFDQINKIDQITISSEGLDSIRLSTGPIKFTKGETTQNVFSKKVNLNVNSDFELNVEDSTNVNDVINFNFIKNSKISIPAKNFNDNFSVGLNIDNNKANLGFKTNQLPIEVKGYGELDLATPSSYKEMTIKKDIIVDGGNLLIKVPKTINTINIPGIKIKNSTKNSITISATKDSSLNTLLSGTDYAQLALGGLTIEPSAKTNLYSTKISGLIKIGNEAELGLYNNIIVSGTIEISYGFKASSSFSTFITLNENATNFNPRKIILKKVETNEKDFNIIQSPEEYFSIDQCRKILPIIADSNPNIIFNCMFKSRDVVLEASLFESSDIKNEKSLHGSEVVGIVLSCIIVAITLIVVLTVFIIVRRRKSANEMKPIQEQINNDKQQKLEDNSEQFDPDVISII